MSCDSGETADSDHLVLTMSESASDQTMEAMSDRLSAQTSALWTEPSSDQLMETAKGKRKEKLVVVGAKSL